jgi:hypothetical protein
MHLHNCRCFQEHLRMLLQHLRALCLASGGLGRVWITLEHRWGLPQCLGGLHVASGPFYILLMQVLRLLAPPFHHTGLLKAPYKLFFPHSKLFFPSKSGTNPCCWDFRQVDKMLIRLIRELLCRAKSPSSLTPATLFPFYHFHFYLSACHTNIHLRAWFEVNFRLTFFRISICVKLAISVSIKSREIEGPRYEATT